MLTAVRRYLSRHSMIAPGDRIGVAVSGGADSVCLLRLLLELHSELGIVLHVVHFEHGLRPESAEDARFVAELAERFSLPFHVSSGDTRAHAAERRISIETAARELRYEFFDSLLARHTVDKIATAHTQSDQAETVIMKLLRGAGARGLSGIHPVLKRDQGTIIRPLLFAPRSEVEAHLADLVQGFRTDATNVDCAHTRNRVRHELMPALRALNPEADATLAQTAEILRAEDEYLDVEAERALPFMLQPGEPVRGGGRAAGVSASAMFSLSLEGLSRHPLAIQRRLVRRALIGQLALTLTDTDRVLALMTADANTALELPSGFRVRRLHRELQFLRTEAQRAAVEYSCEVIFTGEPVRLLSPIGAITISIHDAPVSHSSEARTLPLQLTLRNWRAGDRFHAPYTRASKKVKEHLQALKLTPEQRAAWPVLEDAGAHEILWVKGIAVRRIALNGKLLRIEEHQSS